MRSAPSYETSTMFLELWFKEEYDVQGSVSFAKSDKTRPKGWSWLWSVSGM
jgi:hypothetical protein